MFITGGLFREGHSIKTKLFYHTLPLDHVTTREDGPVLEVTTDCATYTK